MKDKKVENIHNKLCETCYSRLSEFINPEMIFEINKWMTTNEAAAYLSKSTNAIRTAVCRGDILARKFKRRLYFKRSELDNLIETSNTIGG